MSVAQCDDHSSSVTACLKLSGSAVAHTHCILTIQQLAVTPSQLRCSTAPLPRHGLQACRQLHQRCCQFIYGICLFSIHIINSSSSTTADCTCCCCCGGGGALACAAAVAVYCRWPVGSSAACCRLLRLWIRQPGQVREVLPEECSCLVYAAAVSSKASSRGLRALHHAAACGWLLHLLLLVGCTRKVLLY